MAIIPSASTTDYCSKNSGAAAADLSRPVSQKFLDKMKVVGLEAIIRYYDHEDETIKGKTLRKDERDLIIRNNFAIGVVFQHHNDTLSSFTPTRGRQDAQRSLILATENSQPKASAIYFGVDGDWKKTAELAKITDYFKEVNAELATSGYRVGVYGSGLVCRMLTEAGLAELCWLANAKSWPEYDKYYQSRKWRLVQTLPQDCGGRNVDFDFTNGIDTDFGQFGT
jgi:hypothetical protein